MAGQKRPRNVKAHARVVESFVHPHATTPSETIPVASTSSSAPELPISTATPSTFEILDNIRVNSLGSGTDTSIFAGIDKTRGFFDLNFKSLAVTGDLKLTETPTSIVIGLQSDDEPTPIFIESGINTQGDGAKVYKGIQNSALEFRTIKAANSNIVVSQTTNEVVIGLGFTPTTGDVTGGNNVGVAGQEVFRDKTGTTLNFRKLTSSNALLTLSQDASGDQIVLTVNENVLNIANTQGTIPHTRVSGLGALATSTDYNLLTNTPTIPTDLSDLSDVSGSPASGDFLKWDGSAWVPGTPAAQNTFSTVKVGATFIPATTPTTDLFFTASNELTITANAVSRTITYGLKPSGVESGTYTNANVTVDAYGRIISISNGTPGGTSNYVDPLTNVGDLVFRNASNNTARLPIGSQGQILTVVNGVPAWRPLTLPANTGTVTSVNAYGIGPVLVSGGPIVDSGALNISLKNSGVAPGTYTNATITVDQYGRITHAASSSSGIGSISVNSGSGLTGGGNLSSSITLALEDLSEQGLIPGTYTNPIITVDEHGRIVDIREGDVSSSVPVFLTRTEAELEDIDDPINTNSKVAGRAVFDTTNNVLMIATGSNPDSSWVGAAGSPIIVPS